MFRGRYILKLEARGRLSIPSRIREVLNVVYEGKVVLSCGFFEKLPHVLIVPFEEWEKFEKETPLCRIVDRDEESFMTRIRTIGNCEEAKIDALGRILVPEFMREYARLKTETALVGLGTYLAVFSPEVLDEVTRSAEDNLAKVRERLAIGMETGRDGAASGK